LDTPEYGISTYTEEEADQPTDVFKIMQQEEKGQPFVTVEYVASFVDEATAINFCDVWRGKALEGEA